MNVIRFLVTALALQGLPADGSRRSREIPRGFRSWEWWGGLACVAAGSALHFLYGWSGGSPVVALFAPVNESVWEHLKLGLIPLGVLAILEHFSVARGLRRFFPAKLAGIAAMMLFIVGVSYGHTALLGRRFLAIDIGSFVAGVALCQAATIAIVARGPGTRAGNALGAAGLIALAALFMVLTFVPPRWDLFRDSPTGGYGPVLAR